jgi:predicted Zn-dependent protease
MAELEPQDLMHLNAADGWLGLGDLMEANAELEQITPAMRLHPDVLETRLNIYAKAKRWEECIGMAEVLVELAPEYSFGWIHRSFALHELKRTQAALENLLPAVEVFKDEITIRYNLACYECVLGNVSQAKLRLAEAFKLARNQNCVGEWKVQMSQDPDLKPLWRYCDEFKEPV